MKRYLLDTGIAGDVVYRRGPVARRAKEARDAGGIVGIATPLLAELLFGAEYSHAPHESRRCIMRAVAKWPVWTFDRAAAAKYGELAAELKRRGRPMQQNDIQIAAIALTIGSCVVVSKDGDFRDVPGLTVEDWSRDSGAA
ncbi:MAG: type II toxin-antitoxin system VapC family toxin [Chthoniobacteraceae bacterium]